MSEESVEKKKKNYLKRVVFTLDEKGVWDWKVLLADGEYLTVIDRRSLLRAVSVCFRQYRLRLFQKKAEEGGKG